SPALLVRFNCASCGWWSLLWGVRHFWRMALRLIVKESRDHFLSQETLKHLRGYCTGPSDTQRLASHGAQTLVITALGPQTFKKLPHRALRHLRGYRTRPSDTYE